MRASRSGFKVDTEKQSLLATLTNAIANFARAFRVCFTMLGDVVAMSANEARCAPRQHFLKRDTVFFFVLV
ncbi:MAG: hypothetical protein ACOY4O_18120 [Pseudomonadota bacterium]|jgi:hypothetical protein